MTALAEHSRLRVSNTQNQTVTVTVTAKYWKYDSSGGVVYSAEQTLINAVAVSATTGTTVSSTITNTTDKWLGADLVTSFAAGSATSGTGAVTLTLEESTDAGTTWPTQDRGIRVGAERLLAADGTNTRRRNFTIG